MKKVSDPCPHQKAVFVERKKRKREKTTTSDFLVESSFYKV
jgi:hypothetical protein